MTETPEEPLLQEQERLSVDAAMRALPPRLRSVLEMYYGKEMNLRAIASVLGVTEARISQLRSEAVRRLQGAYAGTGDQVQTEIQRK